MKHAWTKYLSMAEKAGPEWKLPVGMMTRVFKEVKDGHALNFPQSRILQAMWLPCAFHVASMWLQSQSQLCLLLSLPRCPFLWNLGYYCMSLVTTESFSGIPMWLFSFVFSVPSLCLILLRACSSLWFMKSCPYLSYWLHTLFSISSKEYSLVPIVHKMEDSVFTGGSQSWWSLCPISTGKDCLMSKCPASHRVQNVIISVK